MIDSERRILLVEKYLAIHGNRATRARSRSCLDVYYLCTCRPSAEPAVFLYPPEAINPPAPPPLMQPETRLNLIVEWGIAQLVVVWS